jgi:diguanylate cyclase (GGDEF)-like protein
MTDVNKLLEKAKKYLQRQKFDSALETYEEIYKHKPDDEEVLLSLSDLSLKFNRTSEGLRYLSQLLDLSINRHNTARALVTCRKILKLSPHDTSTVSKLARLLEETGKSSEALEAYREALHLHRQVGATEQVIDCLQHIVNLDPNSLEVHLELAELASQAKRTKTAASEFLRAAELARQVGQQERWAELVERAHRLEPGDEPACLAAAELALLRARPAEVIALLEPLLPKRPEDLTVLELLTKGYLATGDYSLAEPLCLKLYQAKPDLLEPVLQLLEGLLQMGGTEKALDLASKLKGLLLPSGKAHQYREIMEKIYQANESDIQLLEKLCDVYNETNHEEGLRQALARLFNLYVAGEQYDKSADTLERIVEVSPYDEGHYYRLLNLEGHIDARRYEKISSRVLTPPEALPATGEGAPAEEAKSLEDLIVEAEVYSQYQLSRKLAERLEKLNRLYPGAEEKNPRLRELYETAGFTPKPAESAVPTAAAKSEPAGAHPEGSFQSVDDLRKISEITADLYREASPQGVMHVAVSRMGRALNASRCWGALGLVDRPPELSLEYCSPETPPSNTEAAHKLYAALIRQAADNPEGWPVEDAAQAPALAPVLAEVQTLGIKSLLALPLFDKDEPAGMMLMEQCDTPRSWVPSEILLLKAIATQVVIAANNLKLRRLVRSLAGTDPETGLLPRSAYLECLLAEAQRSKDQALPLSVCLLEPENPTALMKTLGDSGTQRYIQQVSKTLLSSLRQNDISIRYGPLTIAVVLPDTDLSQSAQVAEKVCGAVSQIEAEGATGSGFCAVVCDVPLGAGFDAVDGITELINRLETTLDRTRKEGGKGTLLSKFEG